MFGDLRVFEVLCAGAQDRPPKLPQAVSKATHARSGGTHLRPAMRANAPVQPASVPKSFPMSKRLFRQHLKTSCLVGGGRLPSWCQSISQCVRRSAACRAAGNQSGCRTPERHEPTPGSGIRLHCRVAAVRGDLTSAKAPLVAGRRAKGLLAEPLAQASRPPRSQMVSQARPKSRGQPDLLRRWQALTRGGRYWQSIAFVDHNYVNLSVIDLYSFQGKQISGR